MNVMTRFDYLRRIGSSWVSACGPALPDETYEEFLARQAGIFGEDRVRPAPSKTATAPEAINLMVNCRTVAKLNLTDVDLSAPFDDDLKATLLSIDPVAGAVGDRPVKQWMVTDRWVNILTEDAA